MGLKSTRNGGWVSDYLQRTDSAIMELRAVKRQATTDIDTRIRALSQFRSRITATPNPSTPTCQPSQQLTRLITAPLAGLR